MANRIAFLFACIFCTTSLAAQQSFNYNTVWKKIDSLIERQLYKSAITEVDKYYLQAKKDKQDAQLVKAIACKAMLTRELEEDEWQSSISFLEKEYSTAKEPTKQIIASLTADVYLQYFQDRRWVIYERKATTAKSNDPNTWSSADFQEKVLQLYLASLQHPQILQQQNLSQYDPIIIPGNLRHLRPTLYDLLAHKVLDYLSNDESDISKPSDAFVLNDAASLDKPKIFVRNTYASPDSNSHIFRSIQLYQQLLQFHLQDADPAALIDVDLMRLQYVRRKNTSPYTDQLYKEGLEFIYYQYPSHEQAMQAGLKLAKWWQQKGEGYVPKLGSEVDRMALVQAAKIAKEVANKFPKSTGGIEAKQLLNELEKPSVSTDVEIVNLPNDPFRARLSFKNTQQVYLRIIAIPGNKPTHSNDEQLAAWWKRIANTTPLKSWTQTLPAIQDMREHSAEIKVDGLPVGKYLLLASGQQNFALDKNALCATVFYVSNISYVANDDQYFLLHRKTGKPLNGAKVQLWRSQYDYNTRKYITVKEEQLLADKNGWLKVPAEKANSNTSRSYQLEITNGTDYLFMEGSRYRTYTYNEKPELDNEEEWHKKNARYFSFTDRSLYRPGQTVFFKAIGITKDKETLQSKIYLPGKKVKAILYNTNDQVVGTLEMEANEYGSVHGSFKLPASGITGNYRIEIEGTNDRRPAYFNVEEYKRPKFDVAFEPLEGSYRLKDTLTVKGKAKAYAGNAIDGAKVTYRVVRFTEYIFPWLMKGGRRIYPPHNYSRQEITSGTTTLADGSFNVVFAALPDATANKENDPRFRYAIEATVTDINGESHEAETNVTVGYRSLQLEVDNQNGFYQGVDSNHLFSVKSTNLNQLPTPTNSKWEVYALQAPNRMLRSRLWEGPDTTVMDRAEFEKTFPNDPYETEDDYLLWPKGKLVQQDSLRNTSNGRINIAANALPVGFYVLEATATDKDGNPVKEKTYFAIYDLAKGLLPAPTYQLEQMLQGTVEPGQQARFLQGSTAQPGFVVQQITKMVKEKPVSTFSYAGLSPSIQPFNYSAIEADRGGYTVNRFFVQDNRVYQCEWQVNVPWTNKQLSIELETFRNKLLPGAEETWKLKIKGPNKEKISAELLASMYDESLDQIAPHNWNPLFLWTNNRTNNTWQEENNFSISRGEEKYWPQEQLVSHEEYDRLLTVDFLEMRRALMETMVYSKMESSQKSMVAHSRAIANDSPPAVADTVAGMAEEGEITPPPTIVKDEEVGGKGVNPPSSPVQTRKNFNETAFWFPQLQTDAEGNISFSFTMPEALTSWKLQMLAHTKDLQLAMDTKTVITQKELMVQPNAPRFFRQGDQLELVSKVVNMGDKELTGTAQLELLNATTMQPVDGWFMNVFPQQYFTVAAGQSVAVKFPITIPVQYTDALVYRITARSGNMSDGEEMALPVLSNRMLVTESIPINMRNTSNKQVQWEKLLQSGNSPTLQHQSLTIEFTSNPVWLAIQSLPYLSEYPYECAEQTWNRFYANALAAHIAASMPKIKSVIEQWQTKDTAALLSALQKNETLKSALLEETPWVLAAKSEAEQKRQLAKLFDVVRMANATEKDLQKLEDMQSPNGGFAWFKGGRDDRYMTQYIMSGIGHLNQLKAMPPALAARVNALVREAIPYLDARVKEDYDYLVKHKADLTKNQSNDFAIQYLYMRSFFPTIKLNAANQKAYDYYFNNTKKYYTNRSKQSQAMIALVMHRSKQSATAKAILKALVETSITNPEMGMYWKEFTKAGSYWWQAPIESQALLIEAFAEIENNTNRINDLKTWLLKQKQTSSWESTKATAEACYALLLQGSQWLALDKTVTIQAGNWTVSNNTAEAGTGYFTGTISGEQVKPEMGNIAVTISSKTAAGTTSWGAAYWQYFEDLNKITASSTGLRLQKTFMLQTQGKNGPVLQPISNTTTLKPGDKVVVRLTIVTDRLLEYVHLKDMRAACFEPTEQLSGYQWKGGLGFYQAPKDASMNFFIDQLPKGTWVLDYNLMVTHEGEFSNGISSIQCMYAPEFSSHTAGDKIVVKKQ